TAPASREIPFSRDRRASAPRANPPPALPACSPVARSRQRTSQRLPLPRLLKHSPLSTNPSSSASSLSPKFVRQFSPPPYHISNFCRCSGRLLRRAVLLTKTIFLLQPEVDSSRISLLISEEQEWPAITGASVFFYFPFSIFRFLQTLRKNRSNVRAISVFLLT